ncbi:MAG: ABC transporter permease [Treponema sp.]|nr:ABC transporter permease [Treponema sp.]
MQSRRSFFQKLMWLIPVTQRFSRVDRDGRSAATSFLASLGICCGVMALIVVVSIMNGFQMGFKDAIMELSSYHVRVQLPATADRDDFFAWCASERAVVSVTPFSDAQGLIAGAHDSPQAAIIRALPADVCERDAGFAREMHVISGTFDLTDSAGIVLGNRLAELLSVRVGQRVNLLALSGAQDVSLLSGNRNYLVTGIFRSGYADINAGYAFISDAGAATTFGAGAEWTYGIKLRSPTAHRMLTAAIQRAFPQAHVESWQSYNRSFFGVLQMEKNILLLFVLLIFVVVGVNIYNGMNRLVFERRTEISIFSALGAPAREIKMLFILRGFFTGIAGAGAGLVFGLLLSVQSAAVFLCASKIIYGIEYFFTFLIRPEYADFVRVNSMYAVYASIPARIIPQEVFFITLFGVCAPLVASYLASRAVLSLPVAEVLHDE